MHNANLLEPFGVAVHSVAFEQREQPLNITACACVDACVGVCALRTVYMYVVRMRVFMRVRMRVRMRVHVRGANLQQWRCQ